MKSIQFPQMRSELIDHLRSLSDIDYQRSCWVEQRCPPGVVHDEFDYSVHFFYDDTALAEDPESTIGEILLNENEAGAVRSVVASLDAVFEKHGLNLNDAQYIETSEWSEVLKSARQALEQIPLL